MMNPKFREAWEAKIYPDHGWGGKGGEITDRLFLSKFVKSRDDASGLLRQGSAAHCVKS